MQRFGHAGMHVYVPSVLRTDSLNPLKIGDAVLIRVDGKSMIITPKEERKEATP